ncbi:MAG: hypothetical protein JJU36_07870, partial [Phycisphaeraceae bacterium]|nr:hypothetical protein [Phycisphaeraceae bacterium]
MVSLMMVLLSGLGSSIATAAERGASSELDGLSWRFHTVWADPRVGTQSDSRVAGRPSGEFAYSTAAPSEWKSPEFDDVAWPVDVLPLFGGTRDWGFRVPKPLAVIQARSSFHLSDNSQGTTEITIRYRGGARLMVNGSEVARRHLPEGELDASTLAEDYPRSAFLIPDGERRIGPPGEVELNEPILDRLNSRIRTLSVRISNRDLNQGRNVIAIEVYRTVLPENLPSYAGGRASWATAGLIDARLIAVGGGNLSALPAERPALEAWVMNPLQPIIPRYVKLDTSVGGNPRLPVVANRVDDRMRDADSGTLRLVAARRGSASGQVLVRAGTEAIAELEVRFDGLVRRDGGGRIARDAGRIRFARMPVDQDGQEVG